MSNPGETILLSIKQCMLFKVIGKGGEIKKNAAEWQQSDFMWSGKCLIVRSTERSIIKFIDGNDIEFCTCTASNESVQNVNDSSRYFILSVNETKGGRKATVGLGFVDRANAFDFTATLQDIERRSSKKEEGTGIVQSDDFILKEGEMVSLPFEELKTITDTMGGLNPFDESKVPTIVFDQHQVQQIEIEEEKEETVLVLNEVSVPNEEVSQQPSIDFSAFGQPTSEPIQKQPQPTQQNVDTFDIFASISSKPSTNIQNNTINFDIFQTPTSQNKQTNQNALDILLFN